MASLNIYNKFKELFRGNETAYGRFSPGQKAEEEAKQEGKAWTEKRPLSYTHYQEHLDGVASLGVSPIFEERFVVFSVIDVDQYANGANRFVLKRVEELNIPLLPFRSKSGGLHLYQFFTDKTEAKDAIELMKEYLHVLGLNEKTEIFPKQAYLKGEKIGNWINLPYFGGTDNGRYLMDTQGNPVQLANAILEIEHRSCAIATAREILAETPIFDGPPCLQEIIISKRLGENEGRNNFFFSLGRYWKTKDETRLEEELDAVNGIFEAPLGEEEMETVKNSARTSEASYLCQLDPLRKFCKKTICKAREYGIGNNSISNFSFGLLKKFNSDPPSYVWDIDGAEFEFDNEHAILSQKNFQVLAVRHLGRNPRKIKEDAWNDIINTALSNMEVIEVDPDNDFSAGAMLRNYLVEFLEYRGHVDHPSQISLGGVFKDSMDYVFKVEPFHTFLKDVKRFNSFTASEIRNRLKKLGGESKSKRLEGRQIRAWFVPVDAIEPLIEEAPIDVDFSDVAKKYNEDEGDF
jgi:hypothetical protein